MSNTDTVVLEVNDNYQVEEVHDGEPLIYKGATYDAGYYEVVNKNNAVVEVRTPQLPEALATAYHLDSMLKNRPWEEFMIADITPDDDDDSTRH